MKPMKRVKQLNCLGIESTAHTFGASIVIDNGEICSDVREIYIPHHGRGIHPSEAAQHHNSKAHSVILKALKNAGKKVNDIENEDDMHKFMKSNKTECAPGLGPCLRVGATVARALATYLNKPLVPINHALAHIEIGILTTKVEDPLVVLVSGGHTAISAFGGNRWRIYGETEDITLGNLFDMFARATELATPGGPEVEKMAAKGSKLIDLPYTVKGNEITIIDILMRKFDYREMK